jgi:pyrroloquinoline quinone (PQQ) biosynthesis protein C
MSAKFERSGPLTQIDSYPQWAQDMVAKCDPVKRTVVEHEFWDAMCDCTMDATTTANFMIGIWPVIERFPAYMAQSLLKTRFGRSAGDNLARRWLVRNIRVEQNHAEYWLNWAEGAGVSRESVLRGSPPVGTQTLARWCEEISSRGSLAASVAAVNYAIEGATGEWSQRVFDSQTYADSFPAHRRTGSLRWLQLHAAYDDTHPWEALEIVCTLMGSAPAAQDVAHLIECVQRSYVGMRVSLESCCEQVRELEPVREASVAA